MLTQIPRVGAVATVRNRRGIVAGVEPFDGDGGRLHLVHLEYKDDQLPLDQQLIWELEPRKSLLEPTQLPNVASTDAMPGEDYDALLRAARWTACSPYLDPDGEGPLDRLPISSPFHGAVQVEDYQLVPLLKALQMPRISLLIADDVGLGKTIEAGLIVSELLIRRRIQRVLILTPASLRLQWRDEMWDKFSLPFDLVDRDRTHKLRRQLGIDANPWRSHSRIITSYHYLRQEDVLEQFLAASNPVEGSPHLPWDLLIVDECHNLMPAPFGDVSGLCKMLRILAPRFEHRLFLSATPHNGHTQSFTGLLEMLDPVRFSQTDELKPAERGRIEQIVVRRLKREINQRTSPPRFCTRKPPSALALDLSTQEKALSEAFDQFRTAVRKHIQTSERKRRRAGTFAIEILGKRLLSCPVAFAESWRRCKDGLAEAQAAAESDVAAAEKSYREETGDDRETQSRESVAAAVVGAWLKPLAKDLQEEISAIDNAIDGLGLDVAGTALTEQVPKSDARFDALSNLIDDLVRDNNRWRDDERLVVFTEYKTTLDYLVGRLRSRYDDDHILQLYGGMDEVERELIKNAFNDPSEPVRILMATDAAAEGLNLQRTARYLLHFDCPWNPSKLEQRNGRLDRHGQARDVTVHHFVSDQDQDLKFLDHVIKKVDQIREDLGATGELFDEATHRRLVDGEDIATVQADLDLRVKAARGRAAFKADDRVTTQDAQPVDDVAHLEAMAAELDLDPTSLRDTLEAAMAIRVGRPQLECAEDDKTCRILHPGLPGWSEVIDDSLRRKTPSATTGPVPRLAFSEEPFLEDVGGRQVFNPRPDVLLMHLSHPMLQKALGSLTRRRFPGADAVSRWTVRVGEVPGKADALIIVTVEELAVNDLRESYHHWVRSVSFPVRDGRIGDPLPHQPAQALRGARPTQDETLLGKARELIDECEPDLRDFIRKLTAGLTRQLEEQLAADGKSARKQEDDRYRSRQGEISSLIEENTMKKLEREIVKLNAERQQGLLFNQAGQLEALDRKLDLKQEELERRKQNYEEVRRQLEKERERILNVLLPRRYAMSGEAQVFPVSIEVRFPGGGA